MKVPLCWWLSLSSFSVKCIYSISGEWSPSVVHTFVPVFESVCACWKKHCHRLIAAADADWLVDNCFWVQYFHLQRNRSVRACWHGKQIDIWKNAETTQIFSSSVHRHRLIVLGLFIDVVIVNAENLCQLPVRQHLRCKLNCFACLLVPPLASLSVWNTVFLWPFIVSCLWWLWWCTMVWLSFQHAVVTAALRSRCGHYIFALWFLSFFFFPRLISVVGDWMSTMLPHMVWP